MNYPIQLHDYKGQKIINARELYLFLGSKRSFTTWMSYKINQLNLVENKDYGIFDKNVIKSDNQRGRPKKSYGLTIEAAERIAIEENNEAGRKIKDFIMQQRSMIREMFNSMPQTRPEMLRLLADHEEKIESQKKEIKKLAPKAELSDRFFDTSHLFTFSEAAKALKLEFGRNTLFEIARKKGWLYKKDNEPKQEYINRGYFEYKPYKPYTRPDGSENNTDMKAMITAKGLEWIANQLGVTGIQASLPVN
jgi:anti-repressor protein